MKKTAFNLATALFAVAFNITSAQAVLVYSENFNDGVLDGWTGKGGGGHQGVIADDPKQGDKALTFSGLNAAGDIFTSVAQFAAGTYTLRFDYLGLVVPGSAQVAGNFGGFIGISDALPGSHRWLEGTVLCCGAEASSLVDDDKWHTYDVTFTAAYDFRIMIEDFVGSGGIAGDAWFDNIRLLNDVPEPMTGALMALGLMGFAARRSRL